MPACHHDRERQELLREQRLLEELLALGDRCPGPVPARLLDHVLLPPQWTDEVPAPRRGGG